MNREFLAQVASRVLGSSAVAATTAAGLRQHGFDPQRVHDLLPWRGVAVEAAGFVFKKVQADAESPQNFGLFVRRQPGVPADALPAGPSTRI